MKLLKQVALWMSVASACLIFMGLAFLSAGVFNDLRVSIATERLSDALGIAVKIDGEAYLTFESGPVFVLTDLRLPAEDNPEQDLAKLDLVHVRVFDGFDPRSDLYMSHIRAKGLEVNLIRRTDGKTTWRPRSAERTARDAAQDPTRVRTDLITFLGNREIAFTDMALRIENEISGFEYDFALQDLRIDQDGPPGASVADVRSTGTVNGQPFSFTGAFPDGAPFDATGDLGDLLISISGVTPPDAGPGDFDGQLSLETADVQNTLDVLKLKANLQGVAAAKAGLSRRSGRFSFEDIDLTAQLEKGQVLTLAGNLSDPRFEQNFDLTVALDFLGDAPPPPPAIYVKDIRIEKAEMRVLAVDGNLEIDRFEIKTNAFDEEVRNIGPFRVEQVSRKEDGALELKGLTFQVGPPDRPFVLAEGYVGNLLKLEDYVVTGELDLPADRVLLTLRPEDAARFGRMTGKLRLEERDGEPDLQQFELRTEDTDLWAASLSLISPDLDDLDPVKLNARIETPNGKALLTALRLRAVEIGYLGYDVEASRDDQQLRTQAKLAADDTVITTNMALQITGLGPVLRGTVSSKELRIKDAMHTVQTLNQLSQLKQVYEDIRHAARPDDAADIQPLVLPKTASVEIVADLSDYQPLVVPENASDLAIEDVINPKAFAESIDAEIDIQVEKITGQQGVSRLESQLQMKRGHLRLGPVDVAYGAGRVSATAAMDLLGAPEWLRVSGRTNGWDIGKILDEFEAGVGAYGTLSGRFDLTGRIQNADAFLASMQGGATLEMRNGRIDTGLLTLAGLGVFPWLFSQDRRQGYSEILCLRAPISVNSGRFETAQTVLETDRVQVVTKGAVDVARNRIDITAEPRPVGKPLARSAWPISVTGPLDAPTIAVADRQRRRAVVPLAMPGTRELCVPDLDQLKPVNAADPG